MAYRKRKRGITYTVWVQGERDRERIWGRMEMPREGVGTYRNVSAPFSLPRPLHAVPTAQCLEDTTLCMCMYEWIRMYTAQCEVKGTSDK